MSIFSTGLSGLNAAQNALATTSNNISNIFTPGYNREVTMLGESSTGNGGVQVNDIQRQFNRYIADQLNSATSKTSALETYAGQVEQIDSLLADRDAGLSPLMQDFFSSMEDLASAPADPAARQGVLGSADTLSAQFRSFDGYLQDMQEGINGQIRDEVTQINNTTEQLAGINREIALARAKQGEAPNALLNQRDQLVHELSERMDLRLNVQDGSSYNVSLPNGQPLVLGDRSVDLKVMESPEDPQRMVVGYPDSGGNVIALDEDTISGGSLGGLMGFRAETLDKAQNQIGQMAVSLAVAINQQHANGIDLDGEQGGDLFSIGEPRAFGVEGNGGSAQVDAIAFDADNIDQLKATDYTVRVTDAAAPSFEVIRQDTGQALDVADVEYDSGELSFGGVTLTFDDATQLAGNDRFVVQPVRHAAADLRTAIADTDKIAAAGAGGEAGNNENALALQDLQQESVVGGSASLSEAYASMVSDVGNRTNIVQVNLDAQQGLSEQLRAAQQSESGVNLDEEAANLIRYQQFYQANAKVIDVGRTVIDTVLGLGT
ncbi:flagellar hook-associated protein FlgK [Halomonas organivorans]|uniref:Flagellar hook-associated protein 1 n=1 Tax=Halomonas organivorans TaxID=257772 RepID=A0A7W5G4Q8_9GAMM|nr:flagellar hook-associated protein FlgK [Halomonas organivorans]MBB3140359.1 flagellar hook-associated protein 1 FlgK [Halomonas organivorans]